MKLLYLKIKTILKIIIPFTKITIKNINSVLEEIKKEYYKK